MQQAGRARPIARSKANVLLPLVMASSMSFVYVLMSGSGLRCCHARIASDASRRWRSALLRASCWPLACNL